mmetsp:Transcript_44836/g.83102  ORF Transcript_44836/g.83102 Transcript_44836/m.83102 type:complete len:214 (-) Transcript_44836:253-894(-)
MRVAFFFCSQSSLHSDCPSTKPTIMSKLAFAAVLLAAVASTASAAGNNYTCVIASANMSATDNTCQVDSSDTFKPGSQATIRFSGVAHKDIIAGNFQFKVYEDDVTHFVSSGYSPFFTCTQRGCDRTKPISLDLENPGDVPTNFTANFNLTIPQPKASGRYHIVFTASDQTHYPYDLTGTVSLVGSCTTDADCPANSYCQNGPGHAPPYSCHV